MTVIQNAQNYYDDEDRNRPDRMVYDLNEEKKMVAEATEEIKKDLWERWQKRYTGAQIFPNVLDNVNPNLVDFLLSFNNTIFYNDLAKKFNLNQAQRDTLPQLVWEISISKNWGGVIGLFSGKLNLNPTISDQLVQLMNQNILFKAKEFSEEQFISKSRVIAGGQKESQKIEISLIQAMQTYHNLGEQLITSSPIKLKIFPQPVRPSIKNWIEDYRSVMGAERHGMMERGNYLFHTENTKRLTSGERKKLAEVLRSLDEDVTLPVDPERQEVVFEQTEEMKPVEKMSNSQFPISNQVQNQNVKNADFPKNIPSSNHQLPNSQIQNRPHSGSLPGGEEGYTRNIPNTNFQSPNKIPNTNMSFSSPQTLPSEKSDINHESKIMNQEIDKNQNKPAINQPVVRNVPSYNSKAGQPWEPASAQRGEPRVNGNTVDLRN